MELDIFFSRESPRRKPGSIVILLTPRMRRYIYFGQILNLLYRRIRAKKIGKGPLLIAPNLMIPIHGIGHGAGSVLARVAVEIQRFLVFLLEKGYA